MSYNVGVVTAGFTRKLTGVLRVTHCLTFVVGANVAAALEYRVAAEVQDHWEYSSVLGESGTFVASNDGDFGQYFTYHPATGMTSHLCDPNSLVVPGNVLPDGRIVGALMDSAGRYDAFAGMLDGTLVRLTPPLPGNFESATDINESGLIVGGGNGRAAYWTTPSTVQILGSPSVYGENWAYEVNNSGWIVGQIRIGGRGRAVVWNVSDPNTYRDLMAPGINNSTTPHGLTEAGHVLSTFSTGSFQSFGIWSVDGSVVHLHTEDFSVGDINDEDMVVGGRQLGPGLIWTPTGGTVDINSLLDNASGSYYINRGIAVNNNGQIIAQAIKDGRQIMVYLDPVPEPASLGALALGAAALIRKKRPPRL